MLYRDFVRNKLIYLMLLPVVVYFIIFSYVPMYGAIIAFKEYSPGLGILRSPWIGLRYFISFFNSVYFARVVLNTLLINFYLLVFGFPAPIILALLLNEVRSRAFKRTVQTVSYLPHFISIMVICGLIIDFTSSRGLINNIIEYFGIQGSNLLLKPELFRPIYVVSDIWQEIGWGSIIFLAALTSIDPTQYEAAIVDGANRWKQLIHITLPGLMPTIIILLILRMGQMMSLGYEKIILLYNPSTYETADVISSFVYRRGLLNMDYSFSSAVGLFNSAINCLMLFSTNWIARRLNDTSLW